VTIERDLGSGQSAVYALADSLVQRLAALDPVMATGRGIAGFDHLLTDYSPEAQDAINALRKSTLAELRALAIEDERDRIARDVIEDVLVLQCERYESGEWLREMSIIGSPAMGIRRVFDLMPAVTPEDWATIHRRLREVPSAIESFMSTLAEGVRRGETAARRQVEANIAQADAWSGANGDSYFAGLIASAPEEADRAGLEQAARAAAASYARLGSFLRERYHDAAAEADGVGRERYQLASRSYNGIVLDLEETYAWGWEELYQVEAEMRATAERILPGATVRETIAFLEREPDRAIEGVDAFREWMQAKQDETLAALHGVHFDIPEPLHRIEAMIAPPGGALAMYYTGPSEDFSRPGRTWYPTGGRTVFPLWGEVSISYHEGVPGHHLQVATTKYMADRLSRFQRLLAGTSGYVEGWALYAERLMGELGFLEVPDYYLGMLRAQALRNVRVILDIGMHLGLAIPASERFHGGETWTAELADQFARDRSCFPPDFMASEVTRYLGTPGQAISYKVGERSWLAARDSARKAAGSDFDLKDWHRRALELGPMGLAQLEREFSVL
jgi:uncharacterized protein (DUF885 family)